MKVMENEPLDVLKNIMLQLVFSYIALQEIYILDKEVGKGYVCVSASDCLITIWPCLLTRRRISKQGNRAVRNNNHLDLIQAKDAEVLNCTYLLSQSDVCGRA